MPGSLEADEDFLKEQLYGLCVSFSQQYYGLKGPEHRE